MCCRNLPLLTHPTQPPTIAIETSEEGNLAFAFAFSKKGASVMTDRVGQQLGKYILRQRLGKGGFSEVYLGEHIYLETKAAIKVFNVQLTEEDKADFFREAKIIAGLKHRHIVGVLDFDIEDNTPLLVLEYAPNATL